MKLASGLLARVELKVRPRWRGVVRWGFALGDNSEPSPADDFVLERKPE